MTTSQPYELGGFQSLNPRHILPQSETLEWMAQAHSRATALSNSWEDQELKNPQRMHDRFLRFGCKPTQVGFRGFDTVDIRKHNFDGQGIYTFNGRTDSVNQRAHMNPMGERSKFFAERSLEVFKEMYPRDAQSPDHLIHVTCTGYISPSAPQRLVNDNDWNGKTAVTHAYHMGCYAAMPAIRMAIGTFNDPSSAKFLTRTDVVHTEICTLHMDPSESAPDQMVIHSLFADGHIKYSLYPAGSLERGFKVLAIQEKIIKDSAQDMTWVPTEWGFHMGLSRDVPAKIGAELRSFMENMAKQANCDLGDLMKKSAFAIHPGGPRIIDSVQEILELRADQTADSKEVLFERGNMSSATLPHVWQKLEKRNLASGTKVVSLAFGPGLTIFGAIFQVI